jgi:hypothetical protein
VNRHDDVQVQVRRDGTWYPGWLDPGAWHRDDTGRWRGFVRYCTGPAENRLGAFDQDDIRKVDDKGFRSVSAESARVTKVSARVRLACAFFTSGVPLPKVQ